MYSSSSQGIHYGSKRTYKYKEIMFTSLQKHHQNSNTQLLDPKPIYSTTWEKQAKERKKESKNKD